MSEKIKTGYDLRANLPNPELYSTFVKKEAKSIGENGSRYLAGDSVAGQITRDHSDIAYDVAHAIKPEIDKIVEAENVIANFEPFQNALVVTGKDGQILGHTGVRAYPGAHELEAAKVDLERNAHYATRMSAKMHLSEKALVLFADENRASGLASIAASSARQSEIEAENTIEAGEIEHRNDQIQKILDKKKADPRGMSSGKRAIKRLTKSILDDVDVKKLEDNFVGTSVYKALQVNGVSHDEVDIKKDQVLVAQEITHQNLDYFRSRVSEFDEGQVGKLELFLNENGALSPFLKNLKPQDMSWASWLSSESNGVTDNQLINIMQWHDHFISEYNGKNAEVYKRQIREHYKQAISSAVEKNILPQSALKKMNKVDKVDIDFISIFDAAKNKDNPHHVRNSQRIVLLDPTNQVTANHEFNHAVMGSLSETDRVGLRWLDEAVTEYVARILNGEDPSTTTWESDKTEYTTYSTERVFLSVLVEITSLELRDFVEAYVEGDGIGLAEKIRQDLGYDFLENLAYMIRLNHRENGDESVLLMTELINVMERHTIVS